MNYRVLGPIIRHRFFKFGAVGLLGTLVNLIFLYLGQEFFLTFILSESKRLYLSLGIAIFMATLHNYLLNREWTWRDRKGKTKYGFFKQGGQYFLASGTAIIIQFIFTPIFSRFTHYLAANIMAIVLAAVINYIINDAWTFSIYVFRNIRGGNSGSTPEKNSKNE